MTTREQYAILRPTLNEYQWRIYLGTEAQKIGFGGQSMVAKESGADPKTIRKGMQESIRPLHLERVRTSGGGRKKSTDTDTALVDDLE